MVNSLAVLITLIALNNPIWCLPFSAPITANTNIIQKLAIAIKSILVQLCRKKGSPRLVFSWIFCTLRRKGSEIGSSLSDRNAHSRNAFSGGSLRTNPCAFCAVLTMFPAIDLSAWDCGCDRGWAACNDGIESPRVNCVRECNINCLTRISRTCRIHCLILRLLKKEVWREGGRDVSVADDENREDILISGSKRNPVTHMRANASRLITSIRAEPGWVGKHTWIHRKERTAPSLPKCESIPEHVEVLDQLKGV